jgi:hypothetical protein
MILLTNNLGINHLIKLVYSAQKIRQSIMTDLFTFPPANKSDGNFRNSKIMHFTNSAEGDGETKMLLAWVTKKSVVFPII